MVRNEKRAQRELSGGQDSDTVTLESSKLSEGNLFLVEGYDEQKVNALASEKNLTIGKLIRKD